MQTPSKLADLTLNSAPQIPTSMKTTDTYIPIAANNSMAAPVLPPRPNVQMLRPSTSSYSPYTMGMGSMGVGGYSNFSNYGGYGGGYSGFGMNSYGSYGYNNLHGYNSIPSISPESRFAHTAEASSRAAFESIESIVRTFTSFSVMLEQTYFAMTSSFRAILSVAESVGRMRSMFYQIWTSFAVFRMLNLLVKKLLTLMRLRQKGGKSIANDAWNEVINGGVTISGSAVNSPNPNSNWPPLLFLGVIFSAPYIISKMFSSIQDQVQNENDIETHQVRALHSFTATNSNELSFCAGERLFVFTTQVQNQLNLAQTGWLYAKNQKGEKGIIPANYVRKS